MSEDPRSLDIMKEIVNTGLGEAADALSGLVNTRVIITVPDIHIMKVDQVMSYIKREVANLGVYIAQNFEGAISGRTILCYARECCISLLDTICDNKKHMTFISETEMSTLNEIGNIIMVSYISAISNFVEDRIRFSLPETTVEVSETYFANLVKELEVFDKAIVVKNRMRIKNTNIEGYLFLLLSFDDFYAVAEILKNRLAKK